LEARRAWIALVADAAKTSQERMAILLTRYGSRAQAVSAFCAERADRPIAGLPAYTENEVRFLIRHESAGTLGDVLLRRTQIALNDDFGRATVEDIARILSAETGETISHVTINAFIEVLASAYGIRTMHEDAMQAAG
jgi:glycerol-3-phosphate dehydrogenase